MFESIPLAPPDSILGLADAFRSDPREHKINLSVGVYQDASGQTPILKSVKEAEGHLVREETSKGYLGIGGDAEYGRRVRELVFGASDVLISDGRDVTVQSPGGTGALRIAADFLHSMFPGATVWLSQPTWPNHPSIFESAGLKTATYAYFDAAENGLAWQPLLAALSQAKAGDVVLLHGCCHNPTGIDPAPEQWEQIANVLADRKAIPLVDFAYQGFGEGLMEDAAAVQILRKRCPEMLICSSFSKNFGLYNERVGALTLTAAAPDAAERALSQIKRCIRANYSNPPNHGAAVVAMILSDDDLRLTWEAELAQMRGRIHAMRMLLVEELKGAGISRDFSFLARQKGMFSFSGLTPLQVDRLKSEHAVYIVGSGRINVAGITEQNVRPLCKAIAAVM